MGLEYEIFFVFTFCDFIETLICMSKFSMEACPQMKYELVFQKKRKDTSCHIMSQKDKHFDRKITFNIPKFEFQNGIEPKTFNFGAFVRLTGLWEPNPQKMCKYFCRF